MKKDDITIANSSWNRNPHFDNPLQFADINADFTLKGSEKDIAVYLKSTDELIAMHSSGKLEAIMKSWTGKRMGVFFWGEFSDLKEHSTKLLSSAQKYNVPIIAAIDKPTSWGLVEKYLMGENVWIGDTKELPRPRLICVGGAGAKDFCVKGLEGRLKIESIKYFDVFAAVRDGKPYPDIIKEQSEKFKYFGIHYLKQGLAALDPPTEKLLRDVCESSGAIYRSDSEKQLRQGLEALADALWKRFLSDIDKQFDHN